MFGKKVRTSQEVVEKRSDVVIHTIPDMFYGGKNPDIYTNQTPAVSYTHIKPQEQAKQPVHSRHVWLFVGVGMCILLGIVGLGWYYMRTSVLVDTQGAPTSVVNQISQTPPVVTPVVRPTTTIVIASSTVSSTTISDVAVSDIVFVFPLFGLFDTVDLDADGLTDREEESYGTDPGIWDTDEDGYYDGLEVQHLYSPVQKAPAKIGTSQYVREYIHPEFGYRFLYPAAWQVAVVDTQGEQVLISAQSGEYIEIIRSVRATGENFLSWYARVIGSSARYTDFTSETNRFAFEYMRRPDWLAGFFEAPDAVYTLIYHSANSADVVYRRSMSLVMQSFVPFGSAAPLPEQDVLVDGDVVMP